MNIVMKSKRKPIYSTTTNTEVEYEVNITGNVTQSELKKVQKQFYKLIKEN